MKQSKFDRSITALLNKIEADRTGETVKKVAARNRLTGSSVSTTIANFGDHNQE